MDEISYSNFEKSIEIKPTIIMQSSSIFGREMTMKCEIWKRISLLFGTSMFYTPQERIFDIDVFMTWAVNIGQLAMDFIRQIDSLCR